MDAERYLFKGEVYVYVTTSPTGRKVLRFNGSSVRVMDAAQFEQLVGYGQFVAAPEES